MAISRGFPKTHLFARARAVFAVAASRCDEVFDPPNSITLWRLPPEVEDQLEDAWPTWLESPDEWSAFVDRVDQQVDDNLLEVLTNPVSRLREREKAEHYCRNSISHQDDFSNNGR